MSNQFDPSVKEVRGYIRELSADEKERKRAEARMKAIRDEASLIEDALNKVCAEGETRDINISEVKVCQAVVAKLLPPYNQSVEDVARD